VPIFEPLLQPSRYKGLYGGRGGAKSHGFGDLLIERCLLDRGTRAVCVREYQVSLEQSVKRLLDDKITRYDLGGEFRVLNTHIETPGDGIIIFQGMQSHTAESIKSLEGYDVAWVEEAQNLSQRSLDLLRPTIREEGSELWFSWNPRHATDPVDKLLRSTPAPPDAIVIKSNYRDNPFFPDVLRKEMEWDRARDPEKYAHIWLGEYERRSEARVFKNWKVEEFETPDDVLFYYGGDWGFSVDPSVLVRCWIRGRNLYIDHEAYRVGVEIDHLPQLFDQVPGARSWQIRADSARPETISYLQRHGFPKLVPAVKGKDSVKEGVIFLQGYDIIIHPRCVHTIDEFTMYSYKVDKQTGMVTPILEDKKNHVIDSVRYAIELVRHGFDYEQAGMTSEATW
jgi:phage terminase large subunit